MATKKTNTTGTKTPVAEAVKTEAVKAAAEVKADAAKAVKAVEKVAEKAPAKKPAAKKAAPAKKATPAKKEAKKAAPAKKEAKKAAPAEPDKFALADMVREKFANKDVSKVNEKIAIQIKAYGDGNEYYIYILINDGKVSVEPWGYIGNDVHIDMPIADVVAVVNGKYDFVAKAISGDFYAIGCVTKLLKAYEALIK